MPPDARPTTLVAPKLYTYRVVNVYPHDPNAFTQGLIVRNGEFLEGTGREGQSTLRRVEIATGSVLQSQPLGDEFFGEGITEFGGKIYQLTWRNGVGFVYDADTLAPLGQFPYNTEGWGITDDGTQLIVSDGTSLLQFWDPSTLQPTGGVYVTLFGLPVPQINELEYIDGAVYANVWQTNLLLRIDPAGGQVTGVVDLGGLLDFAPPPPPSPADQPVSQPDVLNGIAYDEATGRLFVTGKLWPAVFEIELVEVTS
jgi:glutamine cyclotransferase